MSTSSPLHAQKADMERTCRFGRFAPGSDIVARRAHGGRSGRVARHAWIMPEAGAPRRQAFERMLAGLPRPPNVSIETTSLPIYCSILATSDRLTLMSRLAAQPSESAGLAVLPFRSPHLRRSDGVASRIDWHPTQVHLRFLQLLRAEAGRLAGRGRAGAKAA